MKDRLQRLVEGTRFQNFIVGLIVINAVILGLETSDTVMARFGEALKFADSAILKVFVVEMSPAGYGEPRFLPGPDSIPRLTRRVETTGR